MTKNILEINTTKVEFTLKKYQRSRSVRVRVSSGGEVTVTAPTYVSHNKIYAFLKQHGQWILDKILSQKKFTHIPIVGSKKNHYEQHKEKAREVINERLAFYNQFYNLTYNRVSIKNTSSRWGSCSVLKNLNFSYKLVLLPLELLDYVVVHELCHLQEMNHGSNFWKLVSRQCPDYKEKRAQLKKYKL